MKGIIVYVTDEARLKIAVFNNMVSLPKSPKKENVVEGMSVFLYNLTSRKFEAVGNLTEVAEDKDGSISSKLFGQRVSNGWKSIIKTEGLVRVEPFSLGGLGLSKSYEPLSRENDKSKVVPFRYIDDADMEKLKKYNIRKVVS